MDAHDTVTLQASVVVNAPKEQVFACLADPLVYMQLDPRVTDVILRGEHEHGCLLDVQSYFLSSLLVSRIMVRVSVDPPNTIAYESADISLPGRLAFASLHGTIELIEVQARTKLVREETYEMRANALGRAAGRRGLEWLERHFYEVQAPRLHKLLEQR